MLGKLMKHEFHAMARIFLPLYVIVAILTPITAYMLSLNLGGVTTVWFEILGGIAIFLYVIVLIGVAAAASILVIIRFYKTMVTDEGYLTHTLPVKTSQHLWSKLLVGTFWQLVTTLLIGISILVFTAILGYVDFDKIHDFIAEAFNAINISTLQFWIFVIEGFIFFLISNLFGIMMYFLSIAIGQLVKNHRIIGAFAAYIAITTALQTISTIISMAGSFLVGSIWDLNDVSLSIGHLFIWAFILFFTLLFFVCFFATNHIFKKKLNLE